MSVVDLLSYNSLGRDVLAAVLGLCVGSFLNVLALRSLAEQSLLSPPSSCPHCQHRIKFYDLIPVVSYLALNGKCRHCGKAIHWQYPLIEIFTASTFVILLHQFGPNSATANATMFEAWGQLIGMTVFSCTLIAVCITDFREKLIPHEITYPSMLLGIAYSGIVVGDVSSALIGIGVSYMLFDFLAFYGLKLYIAMYGDPDNPQEHKKKVLFDRDREGLIVTGADQEIDLHIDHAFEIADDQEDQADEQFEVMGGGDAVLSAVISAWLGVKLLALALLVGFLAGTIMGASYLVYEMFRAKLLKTCIRPAAIGIVIMVSLVEGLMLFLKHLSPDLQLNMPWFQLGAAAAACGALLGILRSGHGVSKPFPFGPPLAFGAVVAMFCKTIIFPGAQ